MSLSGPMRDLIKFLVLPPVVLFVGMGLGYFLSLRRHRAGVPLMAGAFAALVILSLPVTTTVLMGLVQHGVEPLKAGSLDKTPAQAIVILSAGLDVMAPENDGEPGVDAMTLERLRYGARLHRQTRLPILVTGGAWSRRKIILADVMATSLETDFQVKTRWRERQANTTYQNAKGSAEILADDGVDTVLLVTHAWHMPRSRRAFERAGLTVIPAPMGFERSPGFQFGSLLPNAKAFHVNYYALHELLGRVWYGLTG